MIVMSIIYAITQPMQARAESTSQPTAHLRFRFRERYTLPAHIPPRTGTAPRLPLTALPSSRP